MSQSAAISIKNVSKTFKIYDKPQDRLKQVLTNKSNYHREFQALKNINLEILKGETFGIIGQNGSGKSTLLQIIAGTLNPTVGEVHVNGKVAALLELGSGFNPEFTGKENVFMNGTILGLSKKEIEQLYDQIVDFADIGDFINQPVKTYSSGMSVRLAFAVQALVPKEILIVDEALAVGDELFQRKCFAKIEEFKANGGTILFVSHSGSTIIELCDRAALLDAGELLLVEGSSKVVNLYQKLIYAPYDKKFQIREDIKNLKCLNQAVEENEELPTKFVQSGTKSKIDIEADFDPNLIPLETMKYEKRGAEIFDPEITTLSGKRVNLLLPNESYVWRYFVKFYETCHNVRFGMLIKTGSGLELGGAATTLAGNGIPKVTANTIMQVEFTFTPRLNAGIYFLNGGVLGIAEDGEVYLDRHIDLGVFRVLHFEESLMTSLVDFSVSSIVSKSNR
ncbi:ABC transporter ATP-binding protein [Gordoniibacillus kamchatkensis]|uniref:ABC transporter ATP-binding protein n=1 Tax=Gordoniibacillus kamchatkensis TaxID=1590651 RepID=A0ABR5ACG4_9BACL|nr:ABC transporter ATP-binding protein [Paenibacillus sp. VKM B-2647]KIL38719.1 ABC transporter ATP-binding protein [Paenibacillus sp. VKM B-2647]